MNIEVKTCVVALLTGLLIAGCASSPAPQSGTWNPSDAQRTHSNQAQDELDSSVSKEK
jgi:PBP1b-binding outer membrane lipoprotein LpoB